MNDKLFQRDKMYNSKWYDQKNSIWSEFHTQFYIWYGNQKFVSSSESGLLKPPPLKFPNPNPETKTSTEYQQSESRVLERGQIETKLWNKPRRNIIFEKKYLQPEWNVRLNMQMAIIFILSVLLGVLLLLVFILLYTIGHSKKKLNTEKSPIMNSTSKPKWEKWDAWKATSKPKTVTNVRSDSEAFRKFFCVITRIYEISNFIWNLWFWKKFPKVMPKTR